MPPLFYFIFTTKRTYSAQKKKKKKKKKPVILKEPNWMKAKVLQPAFFAHSLYLQTARPSPTQT